MTVSEMASHLDKLQAMVYDGLDCGGDIGSALVAAGVGHPDWVYASHDYMLEHADACGLAQVVYEIYVAVYEKHAV